MIGGEYCMYYLLDGQGQPFPTSDSSAANELLLDTKRRRIDQTVLHFKNVEVEVSTVFLVINHDHSMTDTPVLWETMVFADQEILDQLADLSETVTSSIFAQAFGLSTDIQKRYTSRSDAIQGHKQMVEFVEVCLPRILRTKEKDE